MKWKYFVGQNGLLYRVNKTQAEFAWSSREGWTWTMYEPYEVNEKHSFTRISLKQAQKKFPKTFKNK